MSLPGKTEMHLILCWRSVHYKYTFSHLLGEVVNFVVINPQNLNNYNKLIFKIITPLKQSFSEHIDQVVNL